MANKINVHQRGIGVFFKEGKAEINIWAPNCHAVYLKTSGAEIPLIKQDFGYWNVQTDHLRSGENYQFRLDQELVSDIVSLHQSEGVHGRSQTFDTHLFQWTDEEWKNPPLKDYLFYELHTGTFSPEGTFKGIESKLDYLIQLGITAIEIMPVSQFPGSRNWGYDGVYPFAVQASYGGPQELQHLVNVCHQKGLAVVLDVVYNHLGPEGNYLAKYGPYFTDKYKTPWGSALNFDDAGSDQVRRYFIENVLMWFRDFHIDALRMDAVHAIRDFSPKHLLQEMKEYVNALMEHTGRRHYLIAECDLNDKRFIEPLEQKGLGMDAQWCDEFHHALRVSAGQKREGYYTDFSGVAALAESYEHAYVYHGQYSYERDRTFGTNPENNEGDQFVVFSQNHDQVGNRMLGERTSTLISFEMQKLLAGAVLVSPFLPMLFMGEEKSEENPFLYFVSHSDPDLIAGISKSRKAEFVAFNMEGEAFDAQDENTFLKSKLQWENLSEGQKVMFEYYKALISLRKRQPVLGAGHRKNLKADFNEDANTLILHRWFKQDYVICFMNFSKQEQIVQVPEQMQKGSKLFDSSEPKWNGPKASPEQIHFGMEWALNPESIVIYTSKIS